MQNVNELLYLALESIGAVTAECELESIRVSWLGKKGKFTQILKNIASLPIEERATLGAEVNKAKQELVECIKQRQNILALENIQQKLEQQKIDVSLPGRGVDNGSVHPISQTIDRINAFFTSMGFSIEEGPELEDEFHNFDALNIPPQHPARDMHDTFYISDEHLLRTHTSPVQVRMMKNQSPPIHIICPGKVYRCDSDVTHTPMFHQIEGLVLNKDIHMGHLKHTLQSFIEYFFEKKLPLRFRPSYFPFTEPSAEVDIGCHQCGGKGCRVCSHTGWIEVLGCGMVHPNVLSSCGIDSREWGGFAFGLGVERLAMMYFGVDDLRVFFENDTRFLSQF